VDRNKKIVDLLLKWHQKNRRIFPWRDMRDPYRVLIAEFFLQRTPANRVAKLLPRFLTSFPSPEKLVKADLSHLEETYHSLGLKKRLSWLIESMKIVCESYDGKIPDRIEELLALPGVGEYTASAVLCFAFDREIEIIDANVVRLYSRLFSIPEKLVNKKARKILPKKKAKSYNEAILDFSALVCKKQPNCEYCVLRNDCDYTKNGNYSIASDRKAS